MFSSPRPTCGISAGMEEEKDDAEKTQEKKENDALVKAEFLLATNDIQDFAKR
jgi:hypothetical protein